MAQGGLDMIPVRTPITAQAVMLLVTLTAACASPGKYVWVDAYKGASEEDRPYEISPGDLIQITVMNQDHLTTRTRVRPDGRISLTLLNDVPAAGLTPTALAGEIQARLKEFVKGPVVAVSVEESRTPQVYVTGEVGHPGPFPLETSRGVLQALVNAGGLTPDARKDRIFVLRQGAQPARVRFSYDALTRLEGKAASFALRSGDVVVVE